MHLTRAALADDGRMTGSNVADVRRETVLRIQRVESPHRAVPNDLRDNGSGGDRSALLVAVDDGPVFRRLGTETKAVHQADFRRRKNRPQSLTQAAQVRAVETVAVDHSRRNYANGDARRAAGHRTEKLLTMSRRELLRIVEEPERPHAVLAQALVVEEHGRGDERSSQTATAGLVCTCDEAHAETAVESE